MSCTVSAAWSRPISPPCYTEHGQRCDVVLSGRITTVAIFRSGQLGLRSTVEPNCSGMSTRLACSSVTHDRAFDTYEPSCVPGTARPFFIHVVHSPLGAVGYRIALDLSSWGGEVGAMFLSAGAHLDREARSGAEKHVAASELSSQRGRARSHGTRGSAGAHFDREVRFGVEKYVTTLELNSVKRRDPRPRDT
jgi:hypothetical protein